MDRPGKTVMRVLGVLVLLVVAGGACLYVQASRDPSSYTPATFRDNDERTHSIDRFWDAADELHNHAQNVVPFEWEIKAGHLNEYLALLDPIVAARPTGWSPGDLDKLMARAGLSDPAVAFHDGGITLMVRSTDYDKILSVDITIDELFQLQTVRARVGRLDLPDAVGRAAMDKLKKAIRKRIKNDDKDDDKGVLGELILGINERPMNREWTVDGKDVRITGVKITPEGMTVAMVPIRRGKRTATTMSTGYPPGLIPDSE